MRLLTCRVVLISNPYPSKLYQHDHKISLYKVPSNILTLEPGTWREIQERPLWEYCCHWWWPSWSLVVNLIKSRRFSWQVRGQVKCRRKPPIFSPNTLLNILKLIFNTCRYFKPHLEYYHDYFSC